MNMLTDGNQTLTVLPLLVEKLSYQLGDHKQLQDISFSLSNNTNHSLILGAKGAGKGALLRVCCGLLPASSGRVAWQQPPTHSLAMVFQRPVLLRRSVSDNIRFALDSIKVPRDQQQAQITAALKHAGMASLAKQPALSLSQGEQQRLALIRAWASQPQVLLLDDPCLHLDPASTQAIENLLHTIQRSGTKILLATSNPAQARRLGGDVFFLHQGQLVEQAPASSFFSAPKHPAAQAFIEGKNYW